MNFNDFKNRMDRTGHTVNDLIDKLTEKNIKAGAPRIAAIVRKRPSTDSELTIKVNIDRITSAWMMELYEQTIGIMMPELAKNGIESRDEVTMSFMDFGQIAVFYGGEFAGIFYEESGKFKDFREA